jgi:hypothetical protein
VVPQDWAKANNVSPLLIVYLSACGTTNSKALYLSATPAGNTHYCEACCDLQPLLLRPLQQCYIILCPSPGAPGAGSTLGRGLEVGNSDGLLMTCPTCNCSGTTPGFISISTFTVVPHIWLRSHSVSPFLIMYLPVAAHGQSMAGADMH